MSKLLYVYQQNTSFYSFTSFILLYKLNTSIIIDDYYMYYVIYYIQVQRDRQTMPPNYNCSFNQTDLSVMWAVLVTHKTRSCHIKYFDKININESHTNLILPTHRPWYVDNPNYEVPVLS